MIIYNSERNEVIVKGCSSCPFLWYKERYTEWGAFCCLINITFVAEPLDKFPEECPIMKPDFKFTREIELFNIIK